MPRHFAWINDYLSDRKKENLLWLIFGSVEQEVMDNSLIYFLITVISYPFLALFNAGLLSTEWPVVIPSSHEDIRNLNCLNIFGNAIFIYVCHWGSSGGCLFHTLSRIFCTVVIY